MRRALLGLSATVALALALAAPAAAAPPSAAWKLVITPMPSNFAPGADVEYLLVATNVGAAPTTGSFEVSADLPSGVTPSEVTATNLDPLATEALSCGIATQHVSCASAGGAGGALGSSRIVLVKIDAHVSPSASGEAEVQAAVVGGGGGQASASAITPITSQVQPFGFFEALSAPANAPEGAPAKLAGSHPYEMTLGFGFPTERIGNELISTEHPRDVRIDLPPGMLGDPAATSALCTEAELTSEASPGCPEGSQIGIASITTLISGAGTAGISTDPLYNMVPPPGAPAAFGFNAAGVGLFIHAIAHLRNGRDYGAYTTSNDLLALGGHPIFNTQIQLWGDPSADAHEHVRGACRATGKTPKGEPCPLTDQETPFLTMPGNCPGNPLEFKAFADSWESPEALHETSYESADLQGASVSIEDCGALQYEPAIEARPTSLLTDSPTGLDFTLHQPQQGPEAEPLAAPATATVKDATVTFPAGLAVNPAQAAGLGACSEEQIGFEGEGEEGELDFSEAPQSCPDAAKIATLTAASPVLAQYDEATHEPLRDPASGRAIPRVLSGSVYLAQPFANPFGSLVATYFSIEDPKTGIVAKLAGEGQLDPSTGQITVRVPHSPQLPVEDFHVSVFGGERGAFVSPPTCTPHEVGSELTPWSAPEGLPAHPTDSFTPTSAPGGGPCPTEEGQMPNVSALSAGTLSPLAGTYSPLLFHLSRQDGSQRFAQVQVSLPGGLIAKLAGVGQCSEADIARAKAREAPNQGAAEIADPSCPASSQLGTVTVGVGAGPHPYQATGKVYLSGPYKDAPLSFVIIAPAVSGPFDLGTVVTRAALYLDPETARARAVSDPIPQIIDGVPLDVRTVQMRIDRPDFSLNPTSCDEESFEGQITSALGAIAPLTERFQVGGCSSLPYEPKFTARLFGPTHRGAHPRLRSVFTAKPGEANTARISVALPHSEFIDQAHFRTICTRVQFAAKACPPGAAYGHAQVFTPLLDQPLEGPIYLRSSSHELPDLVLALHGPPSLPIELDAVGRVDSVNGGVRATFEDLPDAPLSKAIVTMQGAKKGLFQNSTDLCRATHRITLELDGQNGKAHDARPELRASCPAHKKRRGRR